jgi:hypothetical protein
MRIGTEITRAIRAFGGAVDKDRGMGLFALFCYGRELERVGRGFTG